MHLAVLVEDFYPNTSGGGLVRWRFCRMAVERGHEVTVFTPRRRDRPASETVEGVEIRRPVPLRPGAIAPYSALGIFARSIMSLLLLVHVVRWARSSDVDGIHTSGYALHWVGKVVGLVCGHPFVPFISYTPSTETEWEFRPKFVLERLNFRFCMGNAVLCRDPTVRDIIEEYVDEPVRVLHGILFGPEIRSAASRCDAEVIRDRYGVGDEETMLVFVGRLVPIKNPTAAVSVIADLPSGYRLTLVGDGPARSDVESAVASHGIDDRVTLAGELPHDDALEVISAADGLVLTSRAESYSAVALEGLALGCHVYATPVGVLEDLDHDRLHVGSTATMAEAIRSTDFRDLSGLDEATLDRFSMERYTDQVFETFEVAVERGDQQ